MVHAHLRRRASTTSPFATGEHLDDDLLSAFTEGRLNENESAPVLSHLVACSFCRHITAELVRLDSDVGPERESPALVQKDDGRIRRMLDELGSRVFAPSDDEAVFAYHSPADDSKAKDGSRENAGGTSEETGERTDPKSDKKS
jgi:hypothetical protein